MLSIQNKNQQQDVNQKKDSSMENYFKTFNLNQPIKEEDEETESYHPQEEDDKKREMDSMFEDV